QQHGAGSHVPQTLAEQRHERGFGGPAVRNQNGGAGCFGFRLEDINGNIAVWRGDGELSCIFQEAARATDEKRMARFAPFGAMRFAEIAEGDVASALW
ncbi:MAG: hypothetical protein WBY12_10395, partial [Hyphomicrobium sp.]